MKRTVEKLSLGDLEDPKGYPGHLENELTFFKSAGKRWAKDILQFLFQDEDGDTKRVLDVGSGVAIIPRALAKMAKTRGLGVEVIGLDKSPLMISLARRKVEEEGLRGISFLEGDALDMPFPDSHFDLVTASFLFFFFGEQELLKFFKEVDRVLKPGGKFYFLHSLRSRSMYLAVYLFTWLVNQKDREFKLRALRLSYTVGETRALINRSPLSSGEVVVRSKWDSLFVEAFGTVNKPLL